VGQIGHSAGQAAQLDGDIARSPEGQQKDIFSFHGFTVRHSSRIVNPPSRNAYWRPAPNPLWSASGCWRPSETHPETTSEPRRRRPRRCPPVSNSHQRMVRCTAQPSEEWSDVSCESAQFVCRIAQPLVAHASALMPHTFRRGLCRAAGAGPYSDLGSRLSVFGQGGQSCREIFSSRCSND